MSILDNIYKQAETVSGELKGMNRALQQMQTSDKREYKLDAQDRKYQKEQDKREAQDQKKFHNKLFDTTERQVKSVGKQEQGKKLAAGLASATSAAIAKSVAKKREEKKLEDSGDVTGGTGGPSFSVSQIIQSPLTPDLPPEDNHEARLAALEKIVGGKEEAKEVYGKFQSGGFTGAVPNLGQPGTGDHFYTHVEPGSYVLNRNAVQAMGFQGGGNVPVALEQGEIVIPPGQYDQKMMDFINYSAAPRFQSGGVVQKSHPDTGKGYSVGPDAYGRPSVLSKGAAEALQKMIDESKGAVKTSDIVSAKRSPEKNQAVGGVANSNHLTGNAMDIHGTSKAWIKEHGHKYGWHNLVYSGHDGHFDFKGQQGPPAPGETRADADVEEKQEETATPEAAEAAGIPPAPEEQQQSDDGLGFLSKIGGGLFAPFFSALNDVVFNGGDNKYGIGIGQILGGASLGTVAKIGADLLTGPAKAATIPQQQGSKGGGDQSPWGGKPGAEVKPTSLGSGGGKLSKLTDQQWKDLAYIVSAEAQPNTDDDFGVAAAVLNRVADPRFPNTIHGVGHQKGQFEAVYKGLAKHDAALVKRLKSNPDKIAAALEKLQGRTDFKGTALYKNMGPGDIKFSSRGNFYHYAEQTGRNTPPPKNPPTHWKKWLGQQKGGLVSLKKAAMSDDLSKFYVQTDNQLQEQAVSESPQVVMMNEEAPETGISVHHSGSNLPTYDLPTRDSCPLSVYYRYHPSLNPQGMNP